MRAILISTQLYPEISRGSSEPRRLLPPLVDRPFLQHVVESIVEAGAREIDLILADSSNVVRELLGNGTRWGVALHYHQIRETESLSDALLTIRLPKHDEPILIAQSDVLPELRQDSAAGSAAPLFFCWQNGTARWTGWAVLQGKVFEGLRASVNTNNFFSQYCEDTGIAACLPHPRIEEVPRPLLVGSYPDLIEAHLRVLRNQRAGLLLTGREIAPKVRISRNVTVHRTTKLIPPVFVGENSRVGEYCEIGPGASIGRDCLIDRHTLIADSVVCPGSYVGEGLELRQVYIDKSRLVNARLLAEVDRVDELMLGSVYNPRQTFARKAAMWTK